MRRGVQYVHIGMPTLLKNTSTKHNKYVIFELDPKLRMFGLGDLSVAIKPIYKHVVNIYPYLDLNLEIEKD